MRRRVGSYAAVIAAICLAAQAASASDAAPKVVVMVAPLTPYVNAIMKGVAVAQSLMKPGQDPHHFAMAPSQAEALANAEILIIPDLAMSPMVALMAKRNPKLRVIELSLLDGADPLSYAADNPWVQAVKTQAHEKDDDERTPLPTATVGTTLHKKSPAAAEPPETKPEVTTVDPHFWLDPQRMAAIAPSLAAALAHSMPGYRAALEMNAAAEARHLRVDVEPAMRTLLSHPRPRNVNEYQAPIPFITYHAAYQYFLARFGLAHQGEITARPEDYLGAKSLDALLASAKKVKINCIIGEARTPIVEKISALSGATLVVLSPEQNVSRDDVPTPGWAQDDYDRLLYKTAYSFAQCL